MLTTTLESRLGVDNKAMKGSKSTPSIHLPKWTIFLNGFGPKEVRGVRDIHLPLELSKPQDPNFDTLIAFVDTVHNHN